MSSKPNSGSKAAQKEFKGIPVSRGFARGPARIVRRTGGGELSDSRIPRANIPAETERLEQALAQTREQIAAQAAQVRQQIGDTTAAILESHLMILDDPFFANACKEQVAKQHNAEWSVAEAARKIAALFADMGDPYLRERAKDVSDIVKRILRNLQGGPADPHLDIGKEPCVIVADELLPSETLALPKHLILAIATDHGSATSHASLLARALRIPAVVGLRRFSQSVRNGHLVLLDGNTGAVTVKPGADSEQAFEQARASAPAPSEPCAALIQSPSQMGCGHPMPLLANADFRTLPEELTAVNAEGVGLFRTEYQWLSLNREPTEDEQCQTYTRIARILKGKRAVIRAWDLGGDKEAPDSRGNEVNPFLGNRSIRLLLHAPETFRRQLRAILRASAHGKLAVMYPMISTLEELRAANRILAGCMAELRAEGIPFDPALPRGAMIEVPSAALIADALAKESDFFSIGSNDLIQYTLAVDRLNEKVSRLYQPTHPAVLKLIDLTVRAGASCGRPVAVCGEMASDPVLAVLLAGLGVNELSMMPSQIPQVKHALSKVPHAEAQALAGHALAMSSETADAIFAICRERVLKQVPDLLYP
ncbi:MAG: phosphoenolpyruvate--protein phosphotransferase [Kiritimatiellaeota bacterium]|nr:phosphoenolpyruvate--protein phosphotransferase [Kiritimatiellota bacterium]